MLKLLGGRHKLVAEVEDVEEGGVVDDLADVVGVGFVEEVHHGVEEVVQEVVAVEVALGAGEDDRTKLCTSMCTVLVLAVNL